MKSGGIPGSSAAVRPLQQRQEPGRPTGADPPFLNPTDTAAVSRVTLPVVAAAVDGVSQVDRTASAALARDAQVLAGLTQQGAPARTLAAAATELFDGLQGRKLTAPDAHEILASLNQASAGLQHSEHYAQGAVIPPEQSEAEGQVARSRDLVDLALRAART